MPQRLRTMPAAKKQLRRAGFAEDAVTAGALAGLPRMQERMDILQRYMDANGLKSTNQRDAIVDAFFQSPGHMAIGDLHQLVLKQNPKIGYATVYRTLRMLVECGLAAERHFGDGQTRYEPHEVDHHHDHLICRSCGTIVEFHNDEIERLQKVLAQGYGYTVESHRHELYGLCGTCQKTRAKRDAFRPVG
jgi:Fur family ferric uptake transcriptional regulator